MKQRIRPIALGVFANNGRILVSDSIDSVGGRRFHRPLGGGIEFGELAEEAIVREIREELDREITDVMLLGVLESRFTYEGRPRHELIFAFDARFVDESIYDLVEIVGIEADGSHIQAHWREWATDAVPLYPEGLTTLLEQADRIPG